MAKENNNENNNKEIEQAAEQLAQLFVAILDERQSDKTTPVQPRRPPQDKGG